MEETLVYLRNIAGILFWSLADITLCLFWIAIVVLFIYGVIQMFRD